MLASLLDLVGEQRWERISVQDVIERAGLFEHAAEMADVIGPLLSQPVPGELSAAVERGLAEALAGMIDGHLGPGNRVTPRFCVAEPAESGENVARISGGAVTGATGPGSR